jgi:DNA (cytosine-5)-methyltransferase 1
MIVVDLFSGAGGAAKGYALAGFRVVCVDIRKQKRNPFEFIQMDVLDFLADWKNILTSMGIDYKKVVLFHASPPCQANSRTQHLRNAQGKSVSELGVNMIPETREALEKTGVHWVIENVEGAPDMEGSTILCGSMFPELAVNDSSGRRWLKRHRLFLASFPIEQMECDHKHAGVRPLGVYGSMNDNIPSGGQTVRDIEEARQIMGIDWMIWSEIKLAIPPAYTLYVAEEFLRSFRCTPSH